MRIYVFRLPRWLSRLLLRIRGSAAEKGPGIGNDR